MPVPGEFVVREARAEDAPGIAQISRDNGRYYASLEPELFRRPDEEGLVELVAGDAEWRECPANLALVAEIDGEVAGYLEASVQEPLETARWQTQRDLGQIRLFISFVGTADQFKRSGVATQLVEAGEAWGREKGAVVSVCDTWLGSPVSIPFWEQRMGYARQSVILRKRL
ncbi:MAG: N-acetyltransferase family protein [Gaiellaceae bacterium]